MPHDARVARMTHDQLAQWLLEAVRLQHFERTEDRLQGGAALGGMPSIDLAVIAFPPGGTPVWANVLFSHEHPQGVVADIGSDASAVRNIRFDADLRAEDGTSPAWQPGADWSQLTFEPLWGEGPLRFVAPYPASLAKLMVAVGVARSIDQGRCGWSDGVLLDGERRLVEDWFEEMVCLSSNRATTALVSLLHRCGALSEEHNALHAAFELYGLPTLSVERTRADGGWDNAAGAGVGALQMTAWDTARLFWLLEAKTPPPWLARGLPPLLSMASTRRLLDALDNQALHDVLSSTALAGEPGWVSGIPAQVPARWIGADGSVQAGERVCAGDVRPASAAATVRFAHKTGFSENYASDAGIVRGVSGGLRRGHYIVALLSSLGTRFAPPKSACVSTWRLPALGRTIDAALAGMMRG
jgi:hypothetical protein